MICRSSGGLAHHIVISYLAPTTTSEKELTVGKNCVLPSVTGPHKSDHEEQIRSNLHNQKITRLTTL